MGTRAVWLQLLLACLALSTVVESRYQLSPLGGPLAYAYETHVTIVPQSPVVEIGTNFTATCMLQNTNAATADDLYWTFPSPLPREQYTKINDSAINVTVTITSKTPRLLLCNCKSTSPDVMMNKSKFVTGILFRKGYPPEKPENLSCVAVQSDDKISNILSCTWEPGKRGSGDLDTTYTLFARITPPTDNEPLFVVAKQNNVGQIELPGIFPHHMELEIWVKAENDLGTVQSEHLEADANRFVKTNPPSNVTAISEDNFTTSLLISWTQPIDKSYVSLIYHIRFCAADSGTWTEVPLEDTAIYIQSFRLQSLTPDTNYVTQVRCKHDSKDNVYWSEWSRNATARLPEDLPKSKPDLWRIITPTDGKKERTVQVICKVPLRSNGKIRSFDIHITKQQGELEHALVNNSDGGITDLGQIDLADKKMAYIEVIARNSVGRSPKATLVIPKTGYERQPVGELKWFSQGGQLFLEWQAPNITSRGGPPRDRDNVTEYVVEWVWLNNLQMDWQVDWQRERASTTRTAIRGPLEKFMRYNVSVYPLYAGWSGKPVTAAAYLEQGAPLEAPSVELEGKAGRNEAMLVWKEIPLSQRRGFITHYTIFYTTEGKKYPPMNVSSDTYSYTLTSLTSNTKYEVWITASTIEGSYKGTEHSFSTSKYAPGQIEGIVVGVCLGFLFLVMLTMFLCIYKKDSIKKNFWPQIPDPGNSSIGAWSPDLPSKADTPKENAMADVSVVEVDLFDGKSVFEEDKACLPLKKDKYLSEEHSSGIGGSSCMSSPRQSVSDSDEGGDSGQTTGSTVQYSSVVASNGYKGQTPGSLPQPQQHTFARSESTQPLLDSEENPDMPLGQEGSGQSHRFPCKPYFRRSPGNEDASDSTELSQLESEEQGGLVSLRFCALEEGSQQTTPTEEGQSPDWQPAASVSSYRPQLSGYRPQ